MTTGVDQLAVLMAEVVRQREEDRQQEEYRREQERCQEEYQ